jgi:opacity protein-like surface antigen
MEADMTRGMCGGVLVVLASLASPVMAQDSPMPRWAIGGAFLTAAPVGEFSNFVDTSFGANVTGHLAVTRVFRVRVDGGFVQYGSEARQICLPNCRIQLDLRTTNNIAYGSIGPELVWPARRVRPYANAGIGGSYFSTSSHLDGVDDDADIGRTTNFDDTTFGVTAGGGVYIPIVTRRMTAALDVGVRYHRNGNARYLREGDLQDNPDGSVSFTPTQSPANLVAFMVGVSVGFGRR